MVVALLYEMQSPCNSFTLSLSGSDSRKSNQLARQPRCYDGDQGVKASGDGDHDDALEMEIKSTR